MATPLITTLIDGVDALEVVGKQIACILAVETEGQKALARAASKNPAPWDLRVYHERSNPWADFVQRDELEDQGERQDRSPVVNVTFDADSTDLSASDGFYQQTVDAVFHVDCIGYGEASDRPGPGHVAADARAACEAQRAARLARQILMAAQYQTLGMHGVVCSRMVTGRQQLVPQMDGAAAQHVVAVRLSLAVRFIEFAPQVVPTLLEQINASITRAEDGRVLATARFTIT